LLEVRQEEVEHVAVGLRGRRRVRRWQTLVGVVVVVGGDAELLELVGALDASGGLADLLDRREEEADEDGDDGDDYQQLDEGKTTPDSRTQTQERLLYTMPDNGESGFEVAEATSGGYGAIAVRRYPSRNRGTTGQKTRKLFPAMPARCPFAPLLAAMA